MELVWLGEDMAIGLEGDLSEADNTEELELVEDCEEEEGETARSSLVTFIFNDLIWGSTYNNTL